MVLEIERKFLVNGPFPYVERQDITQGYLSKDKDKVVRVRKSYPVCYLTVKVAVNDTTKQEYEYPISEIDADELLSCCIDVISKTRYKFDRWEIDVFHGDLEGLVLAEIELKSEDEQFDTPAFIGKEVTGLPEYYNCNLHKLKKDSNE